MKKLLITTAVLSSLLFAGEMGVTQVHADAEVGSKVTAVIKENPNKPKEEPKEEKPKATSNEEYVATGFKDSTFLTLLGSTILAFLAGIGLGNVIKDKKSVEK